MTIEVPIIFNGSYVATGEVSFDDEQKEQIIVDPIRTYLMSIANEEGKKIIDNELSSLTTLPADNRIKDQRMQITFNTINQKIEILFDPTLKKVIEIDLKKKERQWDESELIDPENFSGHINFSINEKIYHHFFSKTPSYSQLSIGSNYLLNWNTWILEGFVYFVNYTRGTQSSLAKRLNRGNISLSKDLLSYSSRLTLGDIYPTSTGFQGGYPLLGFALEKNQRLFRPSATIGPIGQHTFFLNAPSQVTLYINGMFIQRLDLEAGPHKLSNFPLSDGVNQVELKILDPMGNTSSINLNKLYTIHLMQQGEWDYSFSCGFPRFQQLSQRYKYLLQDPTFSFLLKGGINPQLSLASYLQGSKDSLFSGLTLDYGNPLFYFQSQLGFSLNPAHQKGGKWNLTFRSRPTGNPLPFSWSHTLEYTTKHFSYFQATTAYNTKICTFSSSLSKRLSKTIQCSVAGTYGWQRGNLQNSWSGRAMISHSTSRYSLGISTSYRKIQGGQTIFDGVVSLSFSPHPKWGLAANYNTRTQTLNQSTRYRQTLSGNRNVSSSLGITNCGNQTNMTGNLSYQGERYNLLVSHYLYNNALKPLSSLSNIVATTQITANTSIVYAGKTWALSTPISNSFAIIKPRNLPAGQSIAINQSGNRHAALATPYFPAVLTSIPSYANTRVTASVKGDDFFSSYDLGEKTTFVLRGRYKSGYKITLGEGIAFTLEGNLQDQDGKPLSYQAAILIDDLDDTNRSLILTDHKGHFYIENVHEGSYHLQVQGMRHQQTPLVITPNKKGLILLGTITIHALPQEEDPAVEDGSS